MKLLQRAREYAGSLLIRAGVRVAGWGDFAENLKTVAELDPLVSEAADPLHEDEVVPMGVHVTPEAAAMLSQPAKKSRVSPRPPLRGSLAARAHEERRNR